MSTICIFDGTENNLDVYTGKDCMKMFYEYLREHSMKMINFENKKTIPLTNSHIYKKFEHKYTSDKNYCKVKDHCYYTGKYKGGARGICN